MISEARLTPGFAVSVSGAGGARNGPGPAWRRRSHSDGGFFFSGFASGVGSVVPVFLGAEGLLELLR